MLLGYSVSFIDPRYWEFIMSFNQSDLSAFQRAITFLSLGESATVDSDIPSFSMLQRQVKLLLYAEGGNEIGNNLFVDYVMARNRSI